MSFFVFLDRSDTIMGNCLKRSTTDDISLLRGSDSVRESSSEQLGSSSAYQVNILCFHHTTSMSSSCHNDRSREHAKKNKKNISTFDSCQNDDNNNSRKRSVICCVIFYLTFIVVVGAGDGTVPVPDLPSVTERLPVRHPADRRGAGENRKANRPDPTPPDGQVRRLQKEPRVRHLHDGIHDRGRRPLPPLHAHLPHVLHRRLAHAEPHLPELHGARRRRALDQLRNQLNTQ